jgi:hypothetical protein
MAAQIGIAVASLFLEHYPQRTRDAQSDARNTRTCHVRPCSFVTAVE